MKFGKISLGTDYWKVECEPQVRARLKRVFARAPQQAADAILISNTPENARDLLWFLQRYPMDGDWKDLADLSKQAERHREMEAAIAEMLSMRTPPPKVTLAEPPREYQEFVPPLLETRGGLLLADDVGLGKTVTAICCMVNQENLPALVVCPAHMPRQWEAMLHRFIPNLAVHRIRPGGVYPLMRANAQRIGLLATRLPDVIIVSYHTLRQWAEHLARFVRLVVFDECQQLRNDKSLIYAACKHVAEHGRRRLGLSATPIYNYGQEFYWVCNVLLPYSLGTREEFIREWCVGSVADKARISDAVEFGMYLRREGIMLRRTRADVRRELPDLVKVPYSVDSDAEALHKLEKSGALELARIVVSHNEKFRGEKMRAAGELDLLLRQATGVAKAPYVAEFVRLLVENGEKVVLFGWHREVYRIWQERLKDLYPVLYTGTESPAEKQASIEKFKDPDGSPVLIMSLRSGAGVDGIQHCCRTVVVGELDWSPGVHEQCLGRVHRDGQPDPVTAYFMLADVGSDPVIADVLGLKLEQIENVRNPAGGLVERVEDVEPHIQKLARAFLEKRGEHVPGAPLPTTIHPSNQSEASP